MSNHKSIQEYYNNTHFEYNLIWNWSLKSTPALHFGYYDEKATKHAQAIFRANEVMADWANIKPNDIVLDAGCGMGNSSIWLAQNKQANVTGVTLVQKQVDTAIEFAKKQNVENVKFIVSDYLNTPFANESVDIVWAFESICHTPNKLLFYKEAFRILKPGGKVVIAEYIRTERPLVEDKETLLSSLCKAWAMADLDTLHEHKSNAEKAGFINFQNKDVTKNVWISYKNLRKTIRKLKTLAKILFALKIINKVRYDNFVYSGKHADAIEQGIFTYHHLLAQKPI